MNKLNIEATITSKDIEVDGLITSSAACTYYFINASICIKISIDNEEHEATLQTGHTYKMNDYSLPSNSLTVCQGSDLLEQLGGHCESDLNDQETIDYINEQTETSYTKEQMLEIYTTLNDITIESQQIVDNAEHEAQEQLENDDSIYVLYTMREAEQIDENEYRMIQCQESYSLRFDNAEEAEKFVEEKQAQKDLAYICDKETGISNKHEHLSNF